MNKELFSYLRLLKAKGIGVRTARLLLENFDTASEIFDIESKDKLKRILGSSYEIFFDKINLSETDLQVIEQEIDFMEKNKISFVGFLEKSYPSKLKLCEDAPIILFYKGDLSVVENKCLGIVGTRKANAYGLQTTKDMIEDLQSLSPTIVSGFAFGIDIQAHLQAIENACATVAVMGTSFSTIYPKQHQKYVDYLVANKGLIISEYTTWMKSIPEFFIRRNRIIAGLSDAILVVQSAVKGGALSTALYAVGYSREVYAVPGRIGDVLNEGAMWLVQTNRAQLVLSASDIVKDLNWDKKTEVKTEIKRKIDFSKFTEDEQKILKLLEKESLHVDQIFRMAQLPMSKINHLLVMLELNGVITALPGKMFSL